MTRRAVTYCISTARKKARGFSLIELMVAVTIGLLILIATTTLFINVSDGNRSISKTNRQIENGRLAIQLLENDVVHAGFWGTYVPQFDDLTLDTSLTPTDAPTLVPDPCLTYNATNWTIAHKNNLIGIPVQAYDVTAPIMAGTNCSGLIVRPKANTDILVSRHTETCIPGSGGNCDANVAGKLYFQAPLCAAEAGSLARAGSTPVSLNLALTASTTLDAYKGMAVRIVSGKGALQTRVISGYDGVTKIATVSPAWTTSPDGTSIYIIDYQFDTTSLNLHKKDCTTVADARKYISNIYYIRDYATTVGDGIPTLMRSQFDLSGSTLSHRAAVPLINGIDGFKVEFGIDNVSKTGAAVNYAQPIIWATPSTQTQATNRGDGSVDGSYVHCSTAIPCTAAQLENVVVVKLYVLARTEETVSGYNDTKTYVLGSSKMGPFNDGYQRHVFETTVRLINVSGRRETP